MTDMNRQQRRAHKPTTALVPPVAEAVGAAHRELSQPVHVGDLTLVEASEIRTVNALLRKWDEDMEHARRTRTVVALYRQALFDKIVTDRDLDRRDMFSLDDESGAISLTHKYVETETAQASDVAEMATPVGSSRDNESRLP